MVAKSSIILDVKPWDDETGVSIECMGIASVVGCMTSVVGCTTSVVGCMTSVVGCTTSVVGCTTSVVGCMTSVVGCTTSVVGWMTSVVGCMTSVVGCMASVVGWMVEWWGGDGLLAVHAHCFVSHCCRYGRCGAGCANYRGRWSLVGAV